MRIRKNASLVMNPPPPRTTTANVICQLNQSPWDLIPSSAPAPPLHSFPSPSSYLLLNRQFEAGEGSNITWNGSLDDSVGGGESVASMVEDGDNEDSTGADVLINYHDNDTSNTNGASRGTTTRRRGRGVNNNTTSLGRRGGGRAKGAKKGAAASSDSYEFYYYAGFGPLWGKRRAGRDGGGNNWDNNREAGGAGEIKNNNVDANSGGIGPASGFSRANSSSSPLDATTTAVFDFIDEDYDFDDDDEEPDRLAGEIGGDLSKKRMRKPVKARSLKSLM